MDTQEISSYILGVLTGAKGRPITGTQLREIINFKFPDFSPGRYGCSGLREYVRQHVPAIQERGRAGMDYVYGLQGPADTLLHSEAPQDPSAGATHAADRTSSSESAVWRTFASPRTEYRLYGDPATGELSVVRPGRPAPHDSWRQIPPCSADKHVEIAREFLGTLSKDVAATLSTHFGRPDWWLPFYDDVRRVGLADKWITFRRVRILDEMKAVLTQLEIPTTHVPATTPHDGGRKVPVPRLVSGRNALERDTTRLRQIAAAIIENMSASQLRELPVHLGDVLDVLER